MPRLSPGLLSADAAVASLVGLTWAFRSGLAFARPAYWEPRTAIDWIAVVSYSLALAMIAPGMIVLVRLAVRRRSVVVAGGTVAVAALVTALANLAEDGLGMAAFSGLFVGAAIAMLAAFVVLGITLAAKPPRVLALVPLATMIGIGAMEAGGGLLVLAAWGAVAIAMSPGRRSLIAG